MILLDNISFKYLGDDEAFILKGLTCNIPEIRNLVIMGPSGSGKTTLLRILARQLKLTFGQISWSPEGYKDDIYLAPQSPVLLPFRNCIENSILAAELRRKISSDDVDDALDLLAQFELEDAIKNLPSSMSYGMLQRLSLVQTLLSGSKTLLLDEPFSGLDVKTRRASEAAFLEVSSKKNIRNIVVTHNIETAISIADYVLIISGSPWHRLEVLNIGKVFKDEASVSEKRGDANFNDILFSLQKSLLEITGDRNGS